MDTTRPIRILLVEDDNFLAGMYVTKLELEGYSVSLASDGKSGLERAMTEKPDCILLDIILPKLDGFSVLQKLKSNPQMSAIPVILMTNLGTKQDVIKGLNLGATDYLIKAHFMPSEVIAKIKEVLGQQSHGSNR